MIKKRKAQDHPECQLSAVAAFKAKESLAFGNDLATIHTSTKTKNVSRKENTTPNRKLLSYADLSESYVSSSQLIHDHYHPAQALQIDSADANSRDSIPSSTEVEELDELASPDEAQFDLSSENSVRSSARTPELPPVRRLSTFNCTNRNIISNVKRAILLRMRPEETLAILGQYDLCVRKGTVSLLGANLQASSSIYRVYASVINPLPAIQCMDPGPSAEGIPSEGAEVELQHCMHGLRPLRKISPKYGRLWNDRSKKAQNVSERTDFEQRSFSLICSSADDPLERPLSLLELPECWDFTMTKFCEPTRRIVPMVLVCGPKSSGKSTFSRILVNKLVTRNLRGPKTSAAHRNGRNDGVVLMDLDPGQPEFSPPGQLSLIHLRSPVFGPTFTHPTVLPIHGNRLLRAHSIATTTPKDDPYHYTACALELMARYRQHLQSFPACPLVINCPGWIHGIGLEVMVELIKNLGVTDIAYMSIKGPTEIVEILTEAAGKIPFHFLRSRSPQAKMRSSADLRCMQSISYFHLLGLKNDSLRWDFTPLSSLSPWVVSYGGRNPGIFGVMVLGERISFELLTNILDGSLVAVVAIENNAAIAGMSRHNSTSSRRDAVVRMEDQMSADGAASLDSCPVLDTLDEMEDEEYPEDTTQPMPDHPSITRTKAEQLPYLSYGPGATTPLDPRYSYTLGLALVRGIDVRKRTLHLLTPIHKPALEALQEKNTKLVIVRGKLDTPAWAYQEEVAAASHAEKRRKRLKLEETGDETRQWTGKAPWVKMRKDNEGKGVGEQVWKVKRHLKMREPGISKRTRV
ncbi:MAG: Polynucleotide 5'-hydroxyl-kinase grc3 [Pycnora praestabilis]|nr:MAG: Polynucleotide 5'-hydroxyl-kinase grc3 [Pycnora praestabilis]